MFFRLHIFPQVYAEQVVKLNWDDEGINEAEKHLNLFTGWQELSGISGGKTFEPVCQPARIVWNIQTHTTLLCKAQKNP